MDDTELHYLSYDPDEIMKEMLDAYVAAGGDVLYAGDEKEMLLRAVLDILTQAFAGIDNALRMDTLRYAVRDYLDVYGEKRGCERIAAVAAKATATLTFAASGSARTLPAGTTFTADGQALYAMDAALTVTGLAQTATVNLTCTQAGAFGNSLAAGTELQALTPVEGLSSAVCASAASGGVDEEDDETYRERIHTYGLSSVTTGPAQQYEAAARAVSADVIDAKAVNNGAGKVKVYIIPATAAQLTALTAAVTAALDDQSVRPLTDQVSVAGATAISYTLNAVCTVESVGSVTAALEAAVSEYQAWQDKHIGRPFNPDKLAALLYQAGASRVVWDENSEFDGGDVEYTEVNDDSYCSGTVTVEVTSA